MMVCGSCGGSSVAKPVLVDANDGSVIEELNSSPRCFDCGEECELITPYAFEQRERHESMDDAECAS